MDHNGADVVNALQIEFDPWDLAPNSGKADGLFYGDVIGLTSDGHWIVHLNRSVSAPNGGSQYVALEPRYVDQPPISEESSFPYTAAAAYLTEAQALNPGSLETADLRKMPGLVATVYVKESGNTQHLQDIDERL